MRRLHRPSRAACRRDLLAEVAEVADDRLQGGEFLVAGATLESQVRSLPRLLHGLAKGAARRGEEHPPAALLVDLAAHGAPALEAGQSLADPRGPDSQPGEPLGL